jgi:hypothetical protein
LSCPQSCYAQKKCHKSSLTETMCEVLGACSGVLVCERAGLNMMWVVIKCLESFKRQTNRTTT